MSPSTASMAGSGSSRRSMRSVGSTSSGSSRNLRGSARSGNNGSWKGNIRFKTTTEDKTGKRNSFFNAILQGHSIEGRDIPASWYTAVWDTQDNKLVAFVTKVALHAHMRDDEDVHYASNLKYVINKAPTAKHAMSCTMDKKHYCITHVAARYAHDTEHIKKVKDLFVKKFSAANWTKRAGNTNHRGRIASNYLNPRTENNHHGHDYYKDVKLSKAVMKKRMEAKKEQNDLKREKDRKTIARLEAQLVRAHTTERTLRKVESKATAGWDPRALRQRRAQGNPTTL